MSSIMLYTTHASRDLISSKLIKGVIKWVLFSFIKSSLGANNGWMHDVVDHYLLILEPYCKVMTLFFCLNFWDEAW